MKVKCEVDPPIKDVTIIEPVKTFNDGKVRFKLSAPLATVPKTGEGDAVGIDKIQLKFTLLDVDVGILELVETWNVKNNSNTNLKEVLDGLAVFIYDISDDEHNIGHTEDWSTDDNANKEFDVVQELFNQVVPRNRRVFNADNYDLMDENGIFDFKAKRALELFKTHFNVDNTTAGSDFKKLVKDYSLVDSTWANQIIGKKILMGKDAGDNQINTSTDGDTGLYELYDNVVKVFINRMIATANAYANQTTPFKARDGSDRTGFSYCYGCNDSISTYKPTSTASVTEYAVNDDYRGQVPTATAHEYAGLFKDEKEQWSKSGTPPTGHFWTSDCSAVPPSTIPQIIDFKHYIGYWAGIDCSGFVQEMINVAEGIPVDGIDTKLFHLDGYHEVCNGPNISDRYFANRAWVSYFFEPDRTKYLLVPSEGPEKERLQKLFKKGDIIRYGTSHVSIVHSDRWGESTFNTDYDIIHAYGKNKADINNNGNTSDFARKVVRTPNEILLPDGTMSLSNPSGFGRIKLWN